MKLKLSRFALYILAVLASAYLPARLAADTTLVGTMPTDVSVDNKGAVNVTIPLQTPPGRAGMEPKLALSYNSGAGNGPFGIGWSVSTGFPQAITRGRTILARDGMVKGINFTNDDKLYLDGKRLLCISGENGKPDSVYRTEVDSFVEVTAYGAGSDIEGFRVMAKDGTMYCFGSNVYDRAGAKVYTGTDGLYLLSHGFAADMTTKVLGWRLKWVEDRVGNYIEFNYSGGVLGCPGSIKYTGNRAQNVAPAFKIEFNSAWGRPDLSWYQYNSGYYETFDSYVYKINVRSATDADNATSNPIRSFQLNYADFWNDDGVSTKIGLLRPKEVVRTDYSGNDTMSTHTALTWGADGYLPTAPQKFNMADDAPVCGEGIKGNFTGSGHDELLLVQLQDHRQWEDDQLTASTPLFVTSVGDPDNRRFFGTLNFTPSWQSQDTSKGRIRTGDFNGDGKTDLICYGYPGSGSSTPGVDGWYVALSTGSGFGPWSLACSAEALGGRILHPYASIKLFNVSAGVLVGDFDGDGRDDFIVTEFMNAPGGMTEDDMHYWGWYDYVVTNTNGPWYSLTSKCSGSAVVFDRQQIDNPTWATYTPVTTTQPIGAEVTNLDNDGKADLMITIINRAGHSTSNYGDPSSVLFYSLVNKGGGRFELVDKRYALGSWSSDSTTTNLGLLRGTAGYMNEKAGGDPLGFYKTMTDVNGDGLPDIVYLQVSYKETYDDGLGWHYGYNPITGLWEDINNVILHIHHFTLPGSSEPTAYFDYSIINGGWHVGLSRGDGTFDFGTTDYSPIDGIPAEIDIDGTTVRTFNRRDGRYLNAGASYEGFDLYGVNFIDINGDGKKDFVFYAKEKSAWYCILANGLGFTDDPNAQNWGYDITHPIKLDWDINPEDLPWRSSTIDIDGNGHEELFFVGPSVAQEYLTGGYSAEFWENIGIPMAQRSVIYVAHAPKSDLNRVTSITNGLGSTTNISYSTTADASVYTPGVAVSYPIQNVSRPQTVVSDIYKDSGGTTPTHFIYQYSGARTDLSGRGFLGFHSFVTLDTQTNLFKYQFLAQSFPMTGLTAREQTYRYWGSAGSGNFRLISTHDNTVVFDEVGSYGTVYPFISRAVESRYEDSTTAHFTLSSASASSQSEGLFPAARPAGAHITITAESLFDNQSAVQTTIPGGYTPSDRTTDWSQAGTNTVTGSTDYASFAALSFPQKITYGNLKQLKTDFGDGFTETVNTTYKTPVGSLTGLVEKVSTEVSSSGYGTEPAPDKSYTYYGSTPLVASESIDAAGTGLDTTTTYTRDDDKPWRVKSTSISGDSIGTYTVSQATAFDDRFDLPTTTLDTYEHATTAVYHPLFAQPTSVTDVNGAQVTTTYDALGRVLTVTDVLKGLVTTNTYAWDASQTVSVPSGVAGIALTSVYAVSTVTKSTDGVITAKPTVTAYYDRVGRVIRTIKAGFANQQAITDTIYNVLGQVVAISNPYASGGAAAFWTKTAYDPMGRVVTVTAPNGTITTNSYAGRITQVTVAANDRDPQTNSTLVDAKGRTVAVWNADNAPALTAIDGSDTAKSAAVSTASIAYGLDGFGRMRTTTLKGQSQTITAAYDPLGRQTALNDPDKGAWSYVNNALGQVVRQQDAKHNVTTSTFDHLGRPLSRITTEPSGPVETANWYYYDTVTDATRHLVAQGDQGWIGAPQRDEALTTGAPGYGASQATNVHFYDAKGRPSLDLSLIDGKWFYTANEYDAYSRPSQVRHFWRPSGHESPSDQPYLWQDYGTTTTYDTQSYLLSLADTRGNTWWQADAATGYDYLDRPVKFRKGSGHWTQRTYRAEDGLLTAIDTGGGAVQALTFGYDGLGNLATRADTLHNLAETYGYDSLNRLTTRNGAETTAYLPNGNIAWKKDVSGNKSAAYAYDSAKPHAVANAFGYSMQYDANGNLFTRTGQGHIWTTQWAGFDKPRWLAQDTQGNEFVYNANRSRVLEFDFDQLSGGVPSHYTRKRLYARGPAVELEYKNSAGSGATWTMDKVRLYISGPDGTAGAMEYNPGAPAETAWTGKVYHNDHLGSVESITDLGVTQTAYSTDSSGRTGRYSYDAWGQRRDAADWNDAPDTTAHGGRDDLTPKGFTGHEMLDTLGLVHMNGRIYDPLLGRFLSADLVVQFPVDLQSYNRYSYVRNNPLTTFDPSGWEEKLKNVMYDGNTLIIKRSLVSDITHFFSGKKDFPGLEGYDVHMVAPSLAKEIIQREGLMDAEVAVFFTAIIADQAAQTPKTPAEKPIEQQKEKQNSSDGKMDSKNPPSQAPEQNKDDKPSSRELRKNMEAAGRPVSKDEAAHHIVAGTDKRAAESRELLKESNIPINSEANGVALPQNTSSPNPDDKTVHSTMHTNEYHEGVTETLKNTAAEDREAALRAIAEDLEKKKKQ